MNIMMCAAALLAMVLAGPALAQSTPNSTTASHLALVIRGGYLVNGIAGCGNCHTPKGPDGVDLPGRDLAGGGTIEIPNLFLARMPNITQDRDTGIGAWTDAQIALAIREGKRPDGRVIGPPMPIELYRHTADHDLAAIVAYLRTIRPVRNEVAKSEYHVPLPPNYGAPVQSVAAPANTPEARGAYLAGPLGHCTECHTPVGANGQRDWSRLGAGGPPIPGPAGVVVPRNISSHRTAGIGAWSDAQIIRAVTEGISADGRRLSPPMAFGYYARMNRGDLADLVAWLRTVPAQP